MSESEMKTIAGEVEKTLGTLRRLFDYLSGFLSDRLPGMGKTTDSAFVVAGALENYYTAAETLFVRISQAFENSLPPDRWHTELLHKMTIHVPETRPKVISDATASLMGELMRFRHFRRYYFALDYDWRRLDALISIFRDAHTSLTTDLETFLAALSDSV